MTSARAVNEAIARARSVIDRARAEPLAHDGAELAGRLAAAHDTLELEETAPEDATPHAVADALEVLGRALRDLQSALPSAPWAVAAEQIALAMSLLYPLRRALQIELDIDAEPIMLAKPRHRPVLELVPDTDVPPSHERRERARVALDVDIGLHSDTNFFAGFGDDISEGGLFVATYFAAPRR